MRPLQSKQEVHDLACGPRVEVAGGFVGKDEVSPGAADQSLGPFVGGLAW